MDEQVAARESGASAGVQPSVGRRPLVHFTARTGWINDPVGLVWHEDRYHLFFQHLPGSTRGATAMHWGHAVSVDLVRWEEEPVAISPGDGDDGVWSGSVAIGESTPRIFYTAVGVGDIGRGRVRFALPTDDDWVGWRKGPTVVTPADDVDLRMCRDPFVYASGDGWRMLVGAGLGNGDAAALAYSSADQLTWRYDGIAARRSADLTEPVWTGTGWECPQLLRVDGHAVLVVAVWTEDDLCYVACAEVDEDGPSLVPQTWRRLTFGSSLYAPSRFIDAEGREGLLFWLRGVEGAPAGTWTGALSVPYLLAYQDDGLVLAAHPAVLAAWPGDRRDTDTVGGPHVHVAWRPETGDALDLTSRDERWRVVRTADELVVTRDGGFLAAVPMGGADVDVIADGPILEICTGRAVYAAPITPITNVTSVPGAAAFSTRRPGADHI